MLWDLMVGFSVVFFVSLFAFCLGCYVLYPHLMVRLQNQPRKLMIFNGLSSWWLIWPSIFAIFMMAIYGMESVTYFGAICIIGCLIMGKHEGDRILKNSLKRWADANGYRIEGESPTPEV